MKAGTEGASLGARRAKVLLAALGRLERAITLSAFLVLVVVLFADVLSRELTGAGLTWARQMGVIANVFLTLVGIGIASAHGSHLRPRFADGWLPASWGPLLETVQDLLMAVFCLTVAAIAAIAVRETYLLEERFAVVHWAVWPFQLVVPAVFMVASVRHGLMAVYPTLRPEVSGPTAAVGHN